ncbi:hemerythrin domain-containing protein [Sphingomonas gilva]|uniref:Hemerythrin domain-containing protein n=1 Tax=Sphingomonas gilva TaxID=2305907 RepID=A0A396RZQ7_9SPHN|nr:hemerythrin domain-containing protein [Sphingomonas gilva]RHW16585.1 hemerythrin domain-containing protein [Sphingomonas gilva]
MSVLDKVIAAVTPPEGEEARADARQRARATAQPGDWFSLILDHHLKLEDAFAAVKAAGDPASRRAAQKHLGVVLTGHAIAEEAVIYPAMGETGEKMHAELGYNEQAMVKMQMAMLEALDPMSQDYLDKLEHIRGAVAHHMYQEEGTWFIDLKESAPMAEQATLTARYKEEWDRYVGSDA